MTVTLDRARVVPLETVIAVSLRLPFIDHSPSPDEGGCLLSGGRWHSGGASPSAARSHQPTASGSITTAATTTPKDVTP